MSFELGGTVGLKNGLRIIYAFESRTSGKTRRVPCVGPVSLNLTMSQPKTLVQIQIILIKLPHSKPSLECPEDAGLIRQAMKRVSSVQAAFKREWVMVSPIAI